MRWVSPLLLLATCLAGCGFRTHPWDPPDAVTPPPVDGGTDTGFVGSDCDYLFATTFDADRGREKLCTSTFPIPVFEMPIEGGTGSGVMQCWRVTEASSASGWDVGDTLYGGRGTVGDWATSVTFEGRVYNGTILYKKVVEVISPPRVMPRMMPSDVTAVTSGAPYDYGVASGVTLQDATYPAVGSTLSRAGDQTAWLRSTGGVVQLVVRHYPSVERHVLAPGIDGTGTVLLASSPRAPGPLVPVAVASGTTVLVYALPPHPGDPMLAGSASLPAAIRRLAVVVSATSTSATVIALTADGVTAWRPPSAPTMLDVGGRAVGLAQTPTGAAVVRADGVVVELTIPSSGVLTLSPEEVFPDAGRIGTPLVSNGEWLLGTDGIAVRTRIASTTWLYGGPTLVPTMRVFAGAIDAAAVDSDIVLAVDHAMYVLPFDTAHSCD